jgi:hypothetical protein
MKHRVRSMVGVALMPMLLAAECLAWCGDDDQETSHQLSLTDLAGYSAALSGKPTALGAKQTDPPSRVKFKDLWNRPDRFRGRRVTVEGRVMRIFRQGPVGSFPALAEVWITSPAGDPFCVVCPQGASNDQKQAGPGDLASVPAEESKGEHEDGRMPAQGRVVHFTGTFLKMVRYAGADTNRLAPLIVGDARPVPIPVERIESNKDGAVVRGTQGDATAIKLTYWAIGLAAAGLVAVSLARWHLRGPISSSKRRLKPADFSPDSPLEFIEPLKEP